MKPTQSENRRSGASVLARRALAVLALAGSGAVPAAASSAADRPVPDSPVPGSPVPGIAVAGATAQAAVTRLSCPAGEVAVVRTVRTTEVVGSTTSRHRVVVSDQRAVCTSAVGRRTADSSAVYWLHGTPGAFDNVGPGAVADCTVAAAADIEQIFSGAAKPPSAAPWLAAYSQLLGVQDPGAQPSASADLAVGSVLSAWESPGLAGTRIAGATAVGLGVSSAEAALRRGPLYALVDLPAPSDPGASPLVDTDYMALSEWTPSHPGSGYVAGGSHAVAVVGFDARDVFLESWGYVQPVTWSWWTTYATGAWSILR